VQRIRFDDDFLLLLCSDGLSDFDRVEQLWKSHIQPALTDNLSLSGTCKDLIQQSNKLNGHDNVTIALMRGLLSPPDPNEEAPTLETQIPSAAIATDTDINTTGTNAKSSSAKAGALVSTSASAGKSATVAEDQEHEDEEFSSDPELANAETLVTKRKGGAGFLISFLLLLLIVGAGAAVIMPVSNAWLGQKFPDLEKYLAPLRGESVDAPDPPEPLEPAEPPDSSEDQPAEGDPTEPVEDEPTPERSPDSEQSSGS
jgi:protein phosphatase